ncbi:MAG: hypothetical protein M3346_02845 [Actinomycetota bacterium]|nr:hypothetical protein [Actinomycetota bacterium]
MGGVVEALGWGLVAGLVGTMAQTVSQLIEQRFTHREDSTVTVQVGAMLLRPPLKTGEQASRLGLAVHWGHGIVMGAVRGLLGLTALGTVAASVLHYLIVWGGDVMLYVALGIAPMPWKWGGTALATDLFHKLVLSAVTSVVFVTLY